MKRSTKYVALDVPQATTAASVREEGGRVIQRAGLPTDASALGNFVRGMRGAMHVAFEEGTQAQWSHALLAPVVDRVLVCDRRGNGSTAPRPIASTRTNSPSGSGAGRCAPLITRALSARRSRNARGRI